MNKNIREEVLTLNVKEFTSKAEQISLQPG